MNVSVIRGTCPHGKVLFAAVNEPSILRSYSKQIADMLSAGFSIDRSDTPVQLGGDCQQCNEDVFEKANHGQKELFRVADPLDSRQEEEHIEHEESK